MEIDLPKTLVDHHPWQSASMPIWPLTAYTLRRNLAHHAFPHHLSSDERMVINEVIRHSIDACSNSTPVHVPLGAVSPWARSFLNEQFFWREQIKDIGAGASIFTPPSFEWHLLTNGEDHIAIQQLSTSDQWAEPLQELLGFEERLRQTLDFAYQAPFGYLTSHFNHCGTGLSVQIFLHLPVLIASQKIDHLLVDLLPEGIAASPLPPARKHYLGDLVTIQNVMGLGASESELAHRLHAIGETLAFSEKEARAQLYDQPKAHFIDRITRAYGLLSHASQISFKEAIGGLSSIKLGLDLGWITGMSDAHCNHLFFRSRRAHLQHGPHTDLHPDVLRANTIKKALAPTMLTI